MNVDEAVDNYFKIKGRYYSKFNASKLRIIRGKFSLAEKKERVNRIQVQCINCKKMLGPPFLHLIDILKLYVGQLKIHVGWI